MLKDLPEFVQQQILDYLESNNFTAAKSLHDAWIRHHISGRRLDDKYPEVGSLTTDFSFMPKQRVIRIEEMLSAG